MKLTEWSIHPVHLPYAREIHWPSAEEDGADYAVLRLQTDDGLVGVAESLVKPAWNSLTHRSLSVILEELFIPALREVDLEDERAVARAISPIREQRTARSLVETACWDLRAQARGKPMWELWGGDPEVPVSWTVTRQTPQLMAEEAAVMIGRHGFQTLKVKTGQGREIDRVALTEIRSAVGPQVQIMVDANGGYKETEALDCLKELADLGVTVAEDPCPLQPNRAFEQLQAASPIPILVDRGCNSATDAALYLERGARELSLKTNGTGVGEAKRMAELADAQDCAAHVGTVTVSSLGALVALQIQSALPTRAYSLPAETSFFLMFGEEYLAERVRITDGKVGLPTIPGHARLVDWERVHALQPAR
jgi:L-Ala-D/L-Glu epimerase